MAVEWLVLVSADVHPRQTSGCNQPLAVIGAFRGRSDCKNFWKSQIKRALKLSALFYIATSPNRAAVYFVFLGRLYPSRSSLRLYRYK